MRPINYIGTKDNYTFVYNPEELEEFHKQGKLTGDVGSIITEFKDGFVVRECYGTYENPRTEIVYLTMKPMEQFGEWMGDPDKLINPKAVGEDRPLASFRMVFLDFGKLKNEENNTLND